MCANTILFGAAGVDKELSDLLGAVEESVEKIVEKTLTFRASGVTLLDKHGVMMTHEFIPVFIRCPLGSSEDSRVFCI